MNKDINFRVGDTVRVHQKIKEDEKVRIQVFEGVVMSIRGRGENKSFTVRKNIGDLFVERIWPVVSPSIEKIAIKGKLRKKIGHAKIPKGIIN